MSARAIRRLVVAAVVTLGALIGLASPAFAHATLLDTAPRNGELWLHNLDIEPYENATHFQPERRRDRKLLAHKKEIDLIERRSQEKGLTIVPTKIYFTRGKVKVEIALGRGKRQYDRREQIAKDESRREADRARKERF